MTDDQAVEVPVIDPVTLDRLSNLLQEARLAADRVAEELQELRRMAGR